MRRNKYVLGILQLFVALGAIPSGIMMIKDTTGKAVGLDIEILEPTPFQNYFMSGLFLLFFIGFLQLVGAIFSFKNSSLIIGYEIFISSILILWIVAQIYFIGYIHILQLVMIGIGILQFLVSLRLNKQIKLN